MKYRKLLSPVKIGNVTLKNRLLGAKCIANQQETLDGALKFYESIAKNGAAAVCMSIGSYRNCDGEYSPMSRKHMDDPLTQEEFRIYVDAVHRYGALASASLMTVEPKYLGISDMVGAHEQKLTEAPLARLEGMIEDFVTACKALKSLGFDMATFYVCYDASILACSLSPIYNKRTDRFGGATMAERARLTLEIFRRVREACGTDFLIEAQISPLEKGGYTVEDWLDYCELCEGLVDIFQVRGWDSSSTHVNGFNTTLDEPLTLSFAEAFKKRGIKAYVSPVGSYAEPEHLERFLEEGKADFFSIARGFICENDYMEKLLTGNTDDITPCLLCNKCHGAHCSVNPKAGILHLTDLMPHGSQQSRRVAVIGGGPAGMRAALEADRLGHHVELFESAYALGGQTRTADHAWFKWPVARYKNWLIQQLSKSQVNIHLGTTATPERIQRGGYDAIICALGSSPKSVPVPGTENAWFAEQVFGHEEELGKRVVVIGGSATGREAALYLANHGHQVTLLTRDQVVLSDDEHAEEADKAAFAAEANFRYIEHATTTEVTEEHVICRVKHGVPRINYGPMGKPREPDPIPQIPGLEIPELPSGMPQHKADGPLMGSAGTFVRPDLIAPGGPFGPKPDLSHVTEQLMQIPYDSVVVSGGRSANIEEARSFAGLAPKVFLIGDNIVPGSIKECTSSAYAAALSI